MFFAALVISTVGHAGALDGLIDNQASSGLKKACEQGSLDTLTSPGKASRFADKPRSKIAQLTPLFGAFGQIP